MNANGRVNLIQPNTAKQFSLYDKIPIGKSTPFTNALKGQQDLTQLSLVYFKFYFFFSIPCLSILKFRFFTFFSKSIYLIFYWFKLCSDYVSFCINLHLPVFNPISYGSQKQHISYGEVNLTPRN